MPIYSYECIYCVHNFDEINKFKGSGKTQCPKCGNIAFKIPSAPNLNIFKKRDFADGSSTPPSVSTPSQEKTWMKAQGIQFEPAKSTIKYDNKLKNLEKSKTEMEAAFHEAHTKVEQGGGKDEFRRAAERVRNRG